MGNPIYLIEDFGAFGDGCHNDAQALWTATLAVAKTGGTLQLKKNATYYVAHVNGNELDNEFVAAIVLNNVENVTIQGENTTILIDAPLFYCSINNSKKVTIEGLNFNYKIKPFTGARAISINQEQGTADVVADDCLREQKDFQETPNLFGVLDIGTGRWHMYLDAYELLDRATNTYRIHFNKNDQTTIDRLKLLQNCRIILPIFNIGHNVERAFSIDGNTDFTMRNCNVWSVCRFMFALFRNDGITRFDHVNITPEPGSTLPIVGWRDGFHVKENRGQYIWENCKMEAMYDDVFNISASTLYVKEMNPAKTQVNLFWSETKGVYTPLRPGDELTIINMKSGELIGRTKVKKVILQKDADNCIELEDALENLTTGPEIYAFFDSMVAPNSIIRNCVFDGTFRFRGPLTVSNCTFHNRRFWIDIESEIEGPIPKDILFKNCVFTCEDEHEKFFHITSRNASGSKTAYHLENIVFDDCVLNQDNFEIGQGDDVRFVHSK